MNFAWSNFGLSRTDALQRTPPTTRRSRDCGCNGGFIFPAVRRCQTLGHSQCAFGTLPCDFEAAENDAAISASDIGLLRPIVIGRLLTAAHSGSSTNFIKTS